MPLILAIEPDRRQAAQIASIAQGRVGAELVMAESAEKALRALGDRVPDLILTPQLLSPRDDAAITDRLRELGTAATYVQTLTIPVLASAEPRTVAKARGLLSALRRQKAHAPASNGCAPDAFAEQIAGYLERALEARNARGVADPIGIGDQGSGIGEERSGIGSSESSVATAALFDHDPPSHPLLSELLGTGRGTENQPDEVAIPRPALAIEPEWPVHVEATVTADVAIPLQDFWERVQAERVNAPIELPAPDVRVTPALLIQELTCDVEAPNHVDDAAILPPAPAIEPEWPVHVEATVKADVAIHVQDFWEPVQAEPVNAPIESPAPPAKRTPILFDHDAPRHRPLPRLRGADHVTESEEPLDVFFRLKPEATTLDDDVAIRPAPAIEPAHPVQVDFMLADEAVAMEVVAVEAVAMEAATPVEAVTQTTKTQRHREEPQEGLCGSVPLWPVEVTDVFEAALPVDVAVVEAKTPSEVAPPACVETDLTELVDAIAEPAVEPEPEIVEIPEPRPAAKPANKKQRARPAPSKDDWHFFDPDETRFAALLAKLDEITNDAASHPQRPRA